MSQNDLAQSAATTATQLPAQLRSRCGIRCTQVLHHAIFALVCTYSRVIHIRNTIVLTHVSSAHGHPSRSNRSACESNPAENHCSQIQSRAAAQKKAEARPVELPLHRISHDQANAANQHAPCILTRVGHSVLSLRYRHCKPGRS